MIARNVKAYIETAFTPKSYSELSKNSRNGTPLIASEKTEAYSYDDIVRSFFTSNPPTSADAIQFHGNQINIIEFKSGFNRGITPKTYDPSKCLCPKDHTECLPYKDLLLKNTTLEVSEIKDSIHLKAVESRWVLEYHIGPKCVAITPSSKINYIVVADLVKENPVDLLEDIQLERGKLFNENNMLSALKQSLNHYSQISSSGIPMAYDSIDVLTLEEFQQRFA